MINEYVVPALKTAAALNCWQSESNTRGRQEGSWQSDAKVSGKASRVC